MQPPAFCHVPPQALHLDTERLHALPRSARLVFAGVLDHGPATQPDLAKATGLPPRTVRFAAKRLLDEGLIQAHLNFQDVRRRHFCVHARLVDQGHLARLGVDGACVVVVDGNGVRPSRMWRDVLQRPAAR